MRCSHTYGIDKLAQQTSMSVYIHPRDAQGALPEQAHASSPMHMSTRALNTGTGSSSRLLRIDPSVGRNRLWTLVPLSLSVLPLPARPICISSHPFSPTLYSHPPTLCL